MSLRDKIEAYRRKENRTRSALGILITCSAFLLLSLLFLGLEYLFWFDSSTRTVLFYLLLSVTVWLLAVRVVIPTMKFLGYLPSKSDEEIAVEISDKIPELKDELVNYLQLEKESKSELARASAEQKSSRLINLNFLKAIDLKSNHRFSRVLAVMVVVFTAVAFLNPPLITSGAERLVNHSKEYVRPAPFTFNVLNDSLQAFQNDDFTISLALDGQNIPSEVLVHINGSVKRMRKASNGNFEHTINVTKSIEFHFEASGFFSQTHAIELLNKPELNLMAIDLDFPSYTRRASERVTNGGNLTIPYGTKVKWNIETQYAERATFLLPTDTLMAVRKNASLFELESRIAAPGNYTIELENSHAINESRLSYRLNVVPDEYPQLKIEFLPDTSFFNFIVVTGQIEDDYGFKSLELICEIDDKKFVRSIDINRNQKRQQFYTDWLTDSLSSNGKELEFYVLARDNDAISGFKSVKSEIFRFRKPDLGELSDIIAEKSQSAEKQLDKSLSEVEELREKLRELSDRLKSEKEPGWQEEKLIEESLEQREELEQMLQELKEKHDDLIKANQNFEQSEQLQEKSEQLNELIEDLMDDETRQLYEELKKLLEEKANGDEIRDKLSQINRQENRMKNDLERTKELFKRLKMETGLEQVSQQLDSLASKQMQLSEQETDSTASLSEQEKIQEEFNEIAEDLEKIEQLNQELEKPQPLEDFSSDEKQINQEMNDAQEQMKSGDKKKSKKSQQDAAKQMQQMSKKMQKMQAGMEMEVMQENIEQLRKILDDLVKLSFRQETLLGDFREVNSSDPRFIKLSQDQIKLKEDLVVIEDSLMALASRVVQLSSFITKEIEEIDHHMAGSVEQIKDRQRGRALSHQQFSMTSMNNLALLLNDVLQNMQMTMSEAMGNPSQGQEQNMPLPSLGEMQQQLGEQIKKLGEEGKSGEQLSEELARMAAEQEMIRQQLQQLREQLEGQMGGDKVSDDLSKAMQLMEDNEVDLVNKRLTRQLIERQKEITTRMLEAEEALREQEQDPEREGESAQQRDRKFPPSFEEYLKQRKKEIELLRSVPIELKPFYKKEVNEYFRRLSEKQ